VASLLGRQGQPRYRRRWNGRRIPFRNSERNHGNEGLADGKLSIIAERIFVQVSEKAKLRDSLLIRRSLVRALVGEPQNQGVAFHRRNPICISAFVVARSTSVRVLPGVFACAHGICFRRQTGMQVANPWQLRHIQ